MSTTARAWTLLAEQEGRKTSQCSQNDFKKFIAPRRQARKERHLLIFRTLAPPSTFAQDMLCAFARDIVFDLFPNSEFKGKCLMRLPRRTIKKARIEIIR